MKHAYLIIAHNEFEVLKLLVSMLDDERNDIYVHIDKKVKVLPNLSTDKSRLQILDKRIDVRWGHVSQIETELLLFETALANGPYSYYHLISGTHLPLKTQDELHSFFDSVEGQNVVRVWPNDEGDVEFKMRRYHLFRYFEYSKSIAIGKCSHFLWLLILKIQSLLKIRSRVKDSFIKTDNWVSLTNDAVEYLVSNNKHIIHNYAYSFCGDEYFVASELSSHRDRFTLHDTPFLLYVDFIGANPRILSMTDYEDLKRTDYLFARKFSNS